MLPDKIRRVYLCKEKVDFRKQWGGLAAEASRMGCQIYEGDLILFVSRDKRTIKAIIGDNKGVYIFGRRFDAGPVQFQFGEGRKSVELEEIRNLFKGFQKIKKEIKDWR